MTEREIRIIKKKWIVLIKGMQCTIVCIILEYLLKEINFLNWSIY